MIQAPLDRLQRSNPTSASVDGRCSPSGSQMKVGNAIDDLHSRPRLQDDRSAGRRARAWVPMAERREYRTTVFQGSDRRVYVPVPFDPDEVWGRKSRHPIASSVNGMSLRGDVQEVDDVRAVVLGPAWRRDCGIAPGDTVDVVITAEGPQRDDLAEDVAAALAADPVAGEFFDSLAQFYRNAYLKWIDATKRRPDQRPLRIAEMAALLREGKKQRP